MILSLHWQSLSDSGPSHCSACSCMTEESNRLLHMGQGMHPSLSVGDWIKGEGEGEEVWSRGSWDSAVRSITLEINKKIHR